MDKTESSIDSTYRTSAAVAYPDRKSELPLQQLLTRLNLRPGVGVLYAWRSVRKRKSPAAFVPKIHRPDARLLAFTTIGRKDVSLLMDIENRSW